MKKLDSGGKTAAGAGGDVCQRGRNHSFDQIHHQIQRDLPSSKTYYLKVEEFWQSVTWFWGSEATEEERLVNVERLAKMEVDGARQVANAKVDKMIEAKTRSMEQQAMLQEKVAEKLWDLRR